MNSPGKREAVILILSFTLLLVALFPVRLAASSLTLAWDSNSEDDLAGYKIYYGTRSRDYDFSTDVVNVTRYTVRGLAPETLYFLALTAYDFSRNESDFSPEVSAITDDEPAPAPSPSYTLIDDEDGGGCFIATAACGSYLSPRVKILRDFRDEFLISNPLGRKFVHVYYQFGPRIAGYIEENGFLRFVAHQAILPLIGMSSLSLKTTVSQKLLLLMLLLLSLFTLTLRYYFRQIR